MYRNDSYPLEIMKTGLLFLANAKLRPNTFQTHEDPFRALLVYCITEIKTDLWLPLNRNYDVLGLSKDDLSDYKSDKYNHMLIQTKDINFDLLWDNTTNLQKGKMFFLISDFTFPRCYYGRKSKEDEKNRIRYETIVKHSFFNEKSGKDFEWAWGYKSSYGYGEDYKENLKRFKPHA